MHINYIFKKTMKKFILGRDSQTVCDRPRAFYPKNLRIKFIYIVSHIIWLIQCNSFVAFRFDDSRLKRYSCLHHQFMVMQPFRIEESFQILCITWKKLWNTRLGFFSLLISYKTGNQYYCKRPRYTITVTQWVSKSYESLILITGT